MAHADVYLFDISAVATQPIFQQPAFEVASTVLGASEISRMHRLKPAKQQAFAISRILLRKLLSQYLPSVGISAWQIQERKDLPPLILQAERAGLFFSISHSQLGLALAICRDSPVGVDIEHCRPRDFTALVDSWFHADLSNRIKRLKSVQQQSEFYRLWTIFEAYIKSEQKGIFDGISKKLKLSVDENQPMVAVYFSAVWGEYCLAAAGQLDSMNAIVVDDTRLENGIVGKVLDVQDQGYIALDGSDEVSSLR